MLQTKEIEKKFIQIDNEIGMASKMCLSDASASPQLKDSLSRLNKKSVLVKQAVQDNNPAKIVKFVDELEMLGDEAEQVCLKDTNITANVREAVEKVHRDLSSLKRQLH
jgi:hypothetical protein